MTAVTTDVRLLSIYLEDHHALLGAGEHRPEQGDVLTDDRNALRALMDTLEVTPSASKSLVAGLAEQLGRLKPNGRLLERSPLSRVVELDALRTALQDDAALWRVLCAVAETDQRIDAADAATRLGRAQRQAEDVERMRVAAAVAALGGREAASAHSR
jgi:hypothetical protein